MNSLMAFAMGAANRGKERMVFDWDKTAALIREHKPDHAMAGLKDDFEYTGGTIYEAGKPVRNGRTYLASTWATPQLVMDEETHDCYRMESDTPGWNEKTKWPASAIAILNEQ